MAHYVVRGRSSNKMREWVEIAKFAKEALADSLEKIKIVSTRLEFIGSIL